MRSLRLVLVAALVAALPLRAQTGTITGSVVDEQARAVAGAIVRLPARAAADTTGADGAFRFDAVPDGEYVITVAADGFELSREPARVAGGGIATTRIVLVRRRTDLETVVVTESPMAGTLRPAPDVLGTIVTAGARSEVVTLTDTDVNLAEKVGRQVFAKVPGIQVYDMDGAGNQTNVSTRGLDPHRSWEFNVRQDGVSVNSDVYGYPASHYSAPMEAMERVELIRGTAALQYGSQFGGLLNYVTRRPRQDRALHTRATVTAGSFSLLNAFVEAGGRVGDLEYQAYGAFRESDGFRDVQRSRYNAQFLGATWHVSDELSLRAQVGHSWYLYRIPGPLTDVMFADDPTQATRSRNWFSPSITVPSLRAEWRPTPKDRISVQLSGVVGARSSVQFVGLATVADVPDGGGQYATRAVDIDDFDSKTLEVRALREHRILGVNATLAAGLAASDNDMRRRQQGVGSRGSDYDLRITGQFGRDLHYRSRSLAVYLEEMFHLTPRWTLIPGIRSEHGTTDMEGRLAYYDPAEVPRTVDHDRTLFGLRSELRVRDDDEFYFGWSQAYRPMLLKDLLPENATEVSDPGMTDASGWTVETGIRGATRGGIAYDLGAFLMRYDGRFGAYLRDDGSGPYIFKTNVGSTRTLGVELSVDAPIAQTSAGALRGFVAASLFDAIYREGIAVDAGANVSLEGNDVEGVPPLILRTGLSLVRERTTLALQVSHTAKQYGDPLNTEVATATGSRGPVPAYTILDANGSTELVEGIRLRVTLSNLLDARYFTKRPSFYPGPGVWPSDGRSIQVGMEWER